MVEDPADTRLVDDFARLAEELLQSHDEQPTLERIVTMAVETIDAADYCGISLRHADGTVSTPASTDPMVDELDQWQYRLSEGPCLEAVWTLGTYLIADTATEPRWPRWCPKAQQAGIGSVLSLQLETPRQAIGGINLYAGTAHAFTVTDVAVAGVLARLAGAALGEVRVRQGLQTAIKSRQIIGAAQGILMQRFGLTLNQSFELLRRYSQNNNVKLHTLAERLVRSGRLPAGDSANSEATVDQQLTRSLGLTEPVRSASTE